MIFFGGKKTSFVQPKVDFFPFVPLQSFSSPRRKAEIWGCGLNTMKSSFFLECKLILFPWLGFALRSLEKMKNNPQKAF